MNREIKLTSDGSHTLYVPDLNEHYHSVHGAIQEAMHVYINAGLNNNPNENISILEIGFGTGLNCYLTYIEAEKRKLKVKYNTVELYPISTQELKLLNYPKQIDYEDTEVYYKLHSCDWEKYEEINTDFSLKKNHADLCTVSLEDKYDLVYFDAFAPDVQAKLWTEEIFAKIYANMNMGGVLTTYCTKGIVKRALRAVGFKVKRLPGPPGKMQMLRATKIDL